MLLQCYHLAMLQASVDARSMPETWSEIVEIKNTCPFRMHTHINRKGVPHKHYAVSDRGPRDQVRVSLHLPLSRLTLLFCPVDSPQVTYLGFGGGGGWRQKWQRSA